MLLIHDFHVMSYESVLTGRIYRHSADAVHSLPCGYSMDGVWWIDTPSGACEHADSVVDIELRENV